MTSVEEKIDKLHDFVIRLEPFLIEIEKNREWREGNGSPGARFQLWAIWGFLIIIIVDIFTKIL